MSQKFKVNANITNQVLTLDILGRIWHGELANSIKYHIDEAIAKGINKAKVHINSEGGSVFEAQQIVYELKRIPEVEMTVGALAASASTYILCHFSASAYKTSQFMIHKPMSLLKGNEDEVKAELKVLESLTNTYRSAYAKKFKKKESEIEKMWQIDYWMDANEALSMGLINSIIIDDEIQYDNKTIKMMAACGCPNIPKINSKENKMSEFKTIALALGKDAESSESSLVKEIQDLKLAKETAEKDKETAETKYATLVKTNGETLINEAVSLGLIPKVLKDSQMKAFEADPETQTATLSQMIADKKAEDTTTGRQAKLAGALGTGATGGNAGGNTEQSFDYLQKNNPDELRRIRNEEPQKYAQLAKDYSAGVRVKS